ncbi:MAG: hypothetical protein OFPII_31490 [Osedax symbiont Rs1]|nr:MAG: hypothetical protein OFPII_31490 [Osedax symbiont Rs1]
MEGAEFTSGKIITFTPSTAELSYAKNRNLHHGVLPFLCQGKNVTHAKKCNFYRTCS